MTRATLAGCLWLLASLGGAGAARAQISPGPLARPHEGLEGTLRCVNCHGVRGKDEMNALCIQCHKEIAWLVQQRRGFHARQPERRCAECHPDHVGRDFALVSWPGGDPERFDHTLAGYPLDGRHGKVKCAGCHKPSFGIGEAARLTPRKGPGPGSGWIGLERRCSACHADPHRGRFRGACSDCHVTKGFHVIDNGRFDHAQTRFPLKGKHASVRCKDCHDSPGLKGRKNPPFATCTACHADPHRGTATLAGAAVDCSACHTERAFQPASYTVAQHQRARYPLEGRHQQVACRDCHGRGPRGVPAARLDSARVLMRPAFGQCMDCHRDDHGGQLAGRPDKGACNACHTLAGWRPSTVTVAAHTVTRFRLEGRHTEVVCEACHGPKRPGLRPFAAAVTLGSAGVRFRLAELECVSCHLDPHQGRFAARGAHPVAGGCVACHSTQSYRPSTIGVAAHARYDFKLDGAHRAVPCVDCHAELKHVALRSSLVQERWTGAPMLFTTRTSTCQGCHETPHGDQFAARPDKGRCESCHDTETFRPASRFNHERDAQFALRGGHANISCTQCHPTVAGRDHTRRTRYRPVSRRCEACHGEGVGPL